MDTGSVTGGCEGAMTEQDRAARTAAHIRKRLATVVGPDEPGAVVMVVSRNGQLVAEAAGLASLAAQEPNTLATPFDTGSVAKIVTGLAVEILEEEGALLPHTPVRDVLPELPAYTDPLRVWHLTHQESGLRSYFTLLYYMAGWHPRRAPTPVVVFETLCRAGSLAFDPGSRFEYCDSNYFLLARMVERVTGEPFGEFARRRILEPLGMTDSSFTDISSSSRVALGYETYPLELASSYAQRRLREGQKSWYRAALDYKHVGAEGFQASARDLSRFVAGLLLHPAELASRAHERIRWTPRMRESGFGYAYGLNVGTHKGRRFVGHDGRIWGYTASVSAFPDDGIGIVCLTNRGDLGAWHLRDCVLDGLDGWSETAQARPATSRVARVVARYLDPTTARYVEMSEACGAKTIRLCGGGPVELETAEDGTLCGGGLRLAVSARNGPLLVQRGGGHTEAFEPFIETGGRETRSEYTGTYRCAELETAFRVAATHTGVRLTNRDPHRPSMDLDYEPTIPDFFWARDPYPELSQLQFLRAEGRVTAFIYRDVDGDRREDFRFLREPG